MGTQLRHDYLWNDLSDFLEAPQKIKNQEYHAAKKTNPKHELIDICDEEYDEFRKIMMPISYELYRWLDEYFLPAARTRQDIFIPNMSHFERLIEQFQHDPCGRLAQNESDGSFYVNK